MNASGTSNGRNRLGLDPHADATIHPRLPVPKNVALAMGAGLLGLFVGGAVVAFTAAVAAPAIRERIRRARSDRAASSTGNNQPA